jgi:Sugar-transfer associated ATP-grasp
MANSPVSKLFAAYKIENNARSSGRFELHARSWAKYLRHWKQEFLNRSSFTEKWRAWRRGFEAGSLRTFRLKENDYRNYVPDIQFTFYATKINGFFNPIMGNKLVLSNMLMSFGIDCAPLIGQIVRGQAHCFPERNSTTVYPKDNSSTPTPSVLNTLVSWTNDHRKLVFRPHWSGGGEGVFFVNRNNDEWQINGFLAPEVDVLAIVHSLDRYLVTEWINQAEYARRVFPKTSNTVRILTIRDSQGPYIAAAVHRFGSSRSYPVDNFHQGRGGLSVNIDLTNGELGKGLTVNSQGKPQLFTHHPETQSPIEGVRIPHYDSMTNAVLRACEFLPEAKVVGWDVLMTENGYCVLEANAPPGLAVWQVHQPLLANPRNARFFHSHGIRVAKHLRQL